jgi:hypothetical protein
LDSPSLDCFHPKEGRSGMMGNAAWPVSGSNPPVKCVQKEEKMEPNMLKIVPELETCVAPNWKGDRDLQIGRSLTLQDLREGRVGAAAGLRYPLVIVYCRTCPPPK